MSSANGANLNRKLYREVNKRIRELVAGSTDLVELLCECGDGDCTLTIVLSQVEADTILEDASRVLLAAPHRKGSGDQHLVAPGADFVLVRAS